MFPLDFLYVVIEGDQRNISNIKNQAASPVPLSLLCSKGSGSPSRSWRNVPSEKFQLEFRKSGRNFWPLELPAPSTWTPRATTKPPRMSKTPVATHSRTHRWGKRSADTHWTSKWCLVLCRHTHTHITMCFAKQEHIYKLMKSDSYSRFIRSSAYQELLQAKKKVTKTDSQHCFFFKLVLRGVHTESLCHTTHPHSVKRTSYISHSHTHTQGQVKCISLALTWNKINPVTVSHATLVTNYLTERGGEWGERKRVLLCSQKVETTRRRCSTSVRRKQGDWHNVLFKTHFSELKSWTNTC